MKYIKVLGLAAVAAMALMALVGATSASATVLCKETPTGFEPAICPPAATYGPGTEIKGTAVDSVLTTSAGFPNVTCGHSATTAVTGTTGGAEETVTGQITALTFSECHTVSITPTPCTVTVEHTPYHAEIHWTPESHDGTLTVESGGKGNPGASVLCSGVIECRFFKTLFELPVTGGNPAHVTAEEVGLSLESLGICPTSASWDATYEATSPTNIWVAKEE